MKKFLFSVLACGMVATGMTSCQNEADEPINNVQNIETTFPKGAKVASLAINIPNDARTRGEASPVYDLPLWYLAGEKIDIITNVYVRYGVYRSDGSLYYDSDSNITDLLTFTPSTISLKVPLPANDPDAKIFIWADQLGEQSKTQYIIDWNAKTVKLYGSQGILNQDMSKYTDAYCFWGTVPEKRATLQRPFAQVNLLSDEFELESVNKEFQYGLRTDLYFVNEDGVLKYPDKWNWDTDQIWFVNENQVGINFVFNLRGNTLSTHPEWLTTLPKAKVGDRSFEYLGVFYVFAPQTRGPWVDATDNKKVNNFKFEIKKQNEKIRPVEAGKITLVSSQLPDFRANDRIVFYNENKAEEGGGILTKSSDIKASCNYGMFNDDAPQGTSITFTRE